MIGNDASALRKELGGGTSLASATALFVGVLFLWLFLLVLVIEGGEVTTSFLATEGGGGWNLGMPLKVDGP